MKPKTSVKFSYQIDGDIASDMRAMRVFAKRMGVGLRVVDDTNPRLPELEISGKFKNVRQAIAIACYGGDESKAAALINTQLPN